MHDIQALCKRVFVIHKGASLYDGDFEKLVNRVNPKRKLIFEFSEIPDTNKTKILLQKYWLHHQFQLILLIIFELQMKNLITIGKKDGSETRVI